MPVNFSFDYVKNIKTFKTYIRDEIVFAAFFILTVARFFCLFTRFLNADDTGNNLVRSKIAPLKFESVSFGAIKMFLGDFLSKTSPAVDRK